MAGAESAAINDINQSLEINDHLLTAAAEVKKASAQIDVVIHAAGILYALPYLLAEGELVESVSLGADNANSPFDLVTNQRIAEFKFIRWRKKGNAIRNKTLFQDFVRLAREQTDKNKYLYLLDTEIPKRFLAGDRAILKVLDRNRRLADDFVVRYGQAYQTVGEFYAAHAASVKLVGLVNDENIPGIEAFLMH